MSNALGDRSNTKILTAEQLGTPSNHISTLYVDSIIPAPVTDLLPITLDKINNRVGINVAVPTVALDVDGRIGASGDIIAQELVVAQIGMLSNGGITCSAGDVKCTAGRLIGNRVSPSTGNLVDITSAYRGERLVHEFGVGETLIPLESCRGDIVYWRNGSANIGAVLPTAGVRVGFNVTLINSSGTGQRITAGVGGRLDGLGPPNFINMTGGGAPSPYAINIYCIAADGAGGNTWYSTFV
jgi:hypothetical protein